MAPSYRQALPRYRPYRNRSMGHGRQRQVLLTPGAKAAARELQAGKVNFVSSGVVMNQTGQMGFKAFLVRDPDGHAIEIEEK